MHELTAHGDALLEEIIVPLEELQDYNQTSMELIKRKAVALVAEHPELSACIAQFVQAEEEECRLLEEETAPAICLLQRA